MKKLWMLLVLAVLFFIACDMPAIGGNPGEGLPCNDKVLRVHASSLTLEMTANCPYEKECDVKFYFYVKGLPDSLKGMCFGGGAEWRMESFDTSMVVKDWKSYPVSLSHDDHFRFSLFDIDNVEKKYDFDLSGVIHSYTVRGDSVDVNVMENCRFDLYSCKKETVYGNKLQNGKYTFAVNDRCKDHYGYDCLWHNQGPLEHDDLNIDATIYWK